MRIQHEEDVEHPGVRFDHVLGVSSTVKALLVQFISGKRVWLPQSCIDADSEVWQKGQEGTLVVKAWYVRTYGLSE